MLLFLSATDSDENLTLTTNQTAVCLDDYYYLFCAIQEGFSAMCGTSDVNWRNSTGIIMNDSTHIISQNATVMMLKIFITEVEFHEPQTFYCTAATCMSNVLSVGRYGEYRSGTHVCNRIVSCAAGHA